MTHFSELRTTVQPTLAKIHGRKLFASGSPHPGLAYCLNMNIVVKLFGLGSTRVLSCARLATVPSSNHRSKLHTVICVKVIILRNEAPFETMNERVIGS